MPSPYFLDFDDSFVKEL